MKFLFIFATAILFGASSFAQGTLVFSNRQPTGDAPVSLPDGTGAGNLPDVVAQLYLVVGSGASRVLTPLTPTTTFRTTSPAAKFFLIPINPFAVDGVLPGQPATVRMRIHSGPSYDYAVRHGSLYWESNDVFIPRLGGTTQNGEVIPTPELNGLQIYRPLTPAGVAFHRLTVQEDYLNFNLTVIPWPWYTNFVLEASHDLVAWQPPIVTNPPSSFSIPYDPTNAPIRFYRMRALHYVPE